MLLSFVISAQGKENALFKTINSLKRQTNDDYELIIVNDDPSIEKEALEFLKDQFRDNDKIIVSFNNKPQGSSTNWNTGLQLATGDYVSFIKEGDILEPFFVEEIKKITTGKKPKIDILEFRMELSGLFEATTTPTLDMDKIYDLPKDTEVFAHINQMIYGKVFRLKYLKDFRINFRRNVRFDTLFLYKALGQARTFYLSSKVLCNHRSTVLKYSAFDLVNQWPHILNYYRRIGSYKELKNELNYAYYYQMNYDFLNLVKEFGNKALYRKALKYADTKMENKIKIFMKNNTVFLEERNLDFTKRMSEFEGFVSSELRKIGK